MRAPACGPASSCSGCTARSSRGCGRTAKKLAGLGDVVKTAKPGERQEPWLLFKKHDEWERPHADYDVVAALPDSVIAHPLKPLDGGPVAAIRRARTTA